MESTLFEAGGREMMNDILSVCPDMAFILLAPVDNIELLLEALQHGARGYLPTNISETALIRSLYAVEQGELAVSRTMMAAVVSELRNILQAILRREDNGSSTLKDRDLQILRLLATEGSNQDIARHLLITENLTRVNAHTLPREARDHRETAKFARHIGLNRSGHITD
jgi:DNA-binding NarL/FixJ family response regulator